MSAPTKPPLPASLAPRVKLWLATPEGEGIGEGRWRLLEAVDTHGSLAAAAEALGISYRKAWADIRKAEALLETRLLIRERGGAAGGASNLTEEAKALLAAFGEMRHALNAAVERAFATCFEKESNHQ